MLEVTLEILFTAQGAARSFFIVLCCSFLPALLRWFLLLYNIPAGHCIGLFYFRKCMPSSSLQSDCLQPFISSSSFLSCFAPCIFQQVSDFHTHSLFASDLGLDAYLYLESWFIFSFQIAGLVYLLLLQTGAGNSRRLLLFSFLFSLAFEESRKLTLQIRTVSIERTP